MSSSVFKVALCVIAAAIVWRYFSGNTDRPRTSRSNEAKNVTGLKALLEHSKKFDQKKIHKVTDGIYVAVGYAIANMIVIEGKDGIIIVDTTEKPEIALEIYREFRKITSKPLKGIIITHFHVDHVNGATALIDQHPESNIHVYMHESSVFELRRFITLGDINFERGSRQFGIYLSPEKELINAGIGHRLAQDEEVVYRTPELTHLYKDTATFHLAGIEFQLIHTPGETDDQTTVWLPRQRAVFPADNIYEAFPNLYAIRGTPPRSCDSWFRSLDKVRALRAQFMVPSHTRPLAGEEEIYDVITHYRDAIQFVSDQTIRHTNNGLGVNEIVEKVKLPSKLSAHPFLQEFYGTVAWSVRGVYDSLMGWFDGDPVNLNPLSMDKRAQRFKAFLERESKPGATAVDKMLSAARDALDNSDEAFKRSGAYDNEEIQWALEMASLALRASAKGADEYKTAKAVKLEALRASASASTSANARNYYLTCARELEFKLGRLTSSVKAKKSAVLETLTIDEIMSFLPRRFIAEACDDDMILKVAVKFSDTGVGYYYTVRHCVVEFQIDPKTPPKNLDAVLTTDSPFWRQLVAGERSAVTAYATGAFTLEGSLMAFKRFMDFIEKNLD